MTTHNFGPRASAVDAEAGLTIGTIESVAPNRLVALLDLDAPQTTALNAGVPMGFPRLNSFVVIPHESGALVGIVTWLGIEHSGYPKRPGLRDFGLIDLPFPSRKMAVVPVGTLERDRDPESAVAFRLKRGVTVFPSVGDSVAVPSSEQLESLLGGAAEDSRIHIGRALLANDADVCVDPDKMFGRHLAVLGNTGSGKSCSVAGLIRWSLEAAKAARENGTSGPVGSRFIVLDPNGEYSRALADLDGYTIFRPGGGGDAYEKPLHVPAWLMDSHEWSTISYASARVQRPILVEALRDLKGGRGQGGDLARLADFLDGHAGIWEKSRRPDEHQDQKQVIAIGNRVALVADGVLQLRWPDELESERDAVVAAAEDLGSRLFSHQNEWKWSTPRPNDFDLLADAFSAARDRLRDFLAPGASATHEDVPIRFDVAELGPQLDAVVSRGAFDDARRHIGGLRLRVQTLTHDERVQEVMGSADAPELAEWLAQYLGTGAEDTVAVIDLSLMPSDVVEVAVAVATRMIFEALQRHRRMFGHALPTTLVLEEAHTFVKKFSAGDDTVSPAELCTRAFERVAREGRKFGLGLVLSSQRPSELSETVLAQCNSFLLHRLVNDRDQQLVSKLVPDNLGGLMDDLPSLPSRHALLLGWASAVPTLVEIRELEESLRPHSSDPRFWESWTVRTPSDVDWAAVADEWVGGHGET